MENSENIATDDEKVAKASFKYKKDENGLILTIHHTVKENGKLARIRLIVACFNATNKHFVTIDNRGNIFIFDLAKKKYWKLLEKIPKACIIRNIPNQTNVYLIGTKVGRIHCLDVDKSMITRSDSYSIDRIANISFPGIPLTPALAVIHSNHEAILLNLENYKASHKLEFNQAKISLKFVSYVPLSDQIFTCFTNDSVHIWSGITLNTIRMHNPIRTRDRYLKINQPAIIRFSEESSDSKFNLDCNEIKDYSRGLINSFSFSLDGAVVCFTTLDNFILFLSSVSYSLLKVIQLSDITLNSSWLFPRPNDYLLLCRSTKSQLIVFDMDNCGIKLIVDQSNCFRVDISQDRELLYVIKETGEANIYSVLTLIDSLKTAQSCAQLVKRAISQPKALSVGCFDNELRKMLTLNRLIPILEEYGQYPSKYRNLIWTALLDVPCNKAKFMELVHMGIHPNAAALDQNLQLKDITAKRNLVKIFSCLAYWTKVFAYSEFLPGFIFPFVKIFSNSFNACFEILATIITNQCQLWFEFHPLEPLNYLGICENILNYFCPPLAKFYTDMGVIAKVYAWTMLANGFSEVLDDEQWLYLWDNVLSSAPWYLVFCTVAYNIVQRDIIMEMTSKDAIASFFREQNAIDMKKFIKRAYTLMERCPGVLHPRRYMKGFTKLPKRFYPKFQNFPAKLIEAQETEMDVIHKEQKSIDARMRQLEEDETVMIERLDRGLQQEEHSKRMKDVQQRYQETLKREQERVSYQRKLLLLYQKELRHRKGKVVELLDELGRRKQENLHEAELDSLLMDIERVRQRNETDLTLAEENMKDHELRLLAHQYGIEDMLNGNSNHPLRQQFKNAIDKLAAERKQLTIDLQSILKDGAVTERGDGTVSTPLSRIESTIRDLEQEFETTLKEKP